MPQKGARQAISSSAIVLILTFGLLASVVTIFAASSEAFCFGYCDSGDLDLTITTTSISLYSGTASSNTSRGSAALSVIFNNPGSSTGVNSISLTGPGLSHAASVFQCSNKTSCIAIQPYHPFSAPLERGALTDYDTNTTAFYPSANISLGNTYNYIINFFNGQSVSGSLVAHAPLSLPRGPYENYTTTSLMSSSTISCTFSPYIETETINDSSNIYTTVTTISC